MDSNFCVLRLRRPPPADINDGAEVLRVMDVAWAEDMGRAELANMGIGIAQGMASVPSVSKADATMRPLETSPISPPGYVPRPARGRFSSQASLRAISKKLYAS